MNDDKKPAESREVPQPPVTKTYSERGELIKGNVPRMDNPPPPPPKSNDK